MAIALAARLLHERPALVLMEGTGVSGGLALILLRSTGVRFVVSSGDAVGPLMAGIARGLGWPGGVYERLLCRTCSGYIGWTPYLAGRAITFGAPRAMTAPGWGGGTAGPDEREQVRAGWGVGEQDIVFGIVGSLVWSRRYRYCYGLELVRAASRVTRRNIAVVVVGDGDGRAFLEQAIAPSGARVILPGPVPREHVPAALSAFDVASLPQSVDGVGMFRYSTKLPEYLAAALPVVTGQLPLAYDLDEGWLRRLPGSAPWDARYIDALSTLMSEITWDEIEQLRSCVPRAHPIFDVESQQRRVARFLTELLEVGPGV